jgi:mercuric ion transport protein
MHIVRNRVGEAILHTDHELQPDFVQGSATSARADRGAAALGTLASIAALFSAAACCILPLALAAIGVGSAGLAPVVPFHWPLTIGAIIVVAIAWLLYLRKRRACVRDATCTVAPPARSTFLLLCIATVFVTISACWPWIEAPLMRALGGG